MMLMRAEAVRTKPERLGGTSSSDVRPLSPGGESPPRREQASGFLSVPDAWRKLFAEAPTTMPDDRLALIEDPLKRIRQALQNLSSGADSKQIAEALKDLGGKLATVQATGKTYDAAMASATRTVTVVKKKT